jgi:hypothetical protein
MVNCCVKYHLLTRNVACNFTNILEHHCLLLQPLKLRLLCAPTDLTEKNSAFWHTVILRVVCGFNNKHHLTPYTRPLQGYQKVCINTQCEICSRIHWPRCMHVWPPRNKGPATFQRRLWTWPRWMHTCPLRIQGPAMLQHQLCTSPSCMLHTHRQRPGTLWLPINQWTLQVGYFEMLVFAGSVYYNV